MKDIVHAHKIAFLSFKRILAIALSLDDFMCSRKVAIEKNDRELEIS